MVSITLHDGTKIENLHWNGSALVSATEVDITLLTDANLVTVQITDEDESGEIQSTSTMHNAKLLQQKYYDNGDESGWYLDFTEASQLETLQTELNSKLDYIAMMTDVDMEV